MRDPDDLDNVTPLRAVASSDAPSAGPPGGGDDAPPHLPPDRPIGDGADLPPDEALRAVLETCAGEPLNDYGNGRRFAAHFGEDWRWVPRVGWHGWAGHVWLKDENDLAVRAQAQRISGLILREMPFLTLPQGEQALIAARDEVFGRVAELEAVAAGERSEDQRSELADMKRRRDVILQLEKRLADRRTRHRSFAQTTGNSARIDNALTEAKPALAVPFDDLDAAPLEVNTPSCVLRFAVVEDAEAGLSRTAELQVLPHDRGRLMSKSTAFGYDPDAACPKFDTFLAWAIPDPEVREFLLRWFGLSMSGLTVQKMAYFYGSGRNGKSVLMEVIARVLGSYAASARIESLTGTNRRGGGDATPDLIPLMGARMVRTSEPDEGQRLQEGLIKELTGGEPLLVRALHSDFVQVTPVFCLTISGNHKLEIRGTDDGIWRRVMLVEFGQQVPEAEARDFEEMVADLLTEGPGILRRLAHGLMDYREGGLRVPASVQAATDEYRSESDPIGQFLQECCVVSGDDTVTMPSKDLCEGFNLYLADRGESMWKPTTVSKRMKDASRRWRDPATGRRFVDHKSNTAKYLGIAFNDTFRRRFEAAPIDAQGRRAPSASSPHPY